MKSLFGTDGIRGEANSGNMTADLALKLGMAVGHLFTKGSHKHRVVIGKDTRLSGYLLESALTAGLISVGMDVVLVGPMPTPAVAMLTRSLRADLGVMISASHNPYQDNGIKLFAPDGYKLSDEMELEVERIVFSDRINDLLAGPSSLGKASRLADAAGRYIEFVKNTFPRGSRLDGLKIVIDGANGAAYNIGGSILYELGADVVQIGVSPNGVNINLNCGSAHPEALQAAVVQHKADIGIALDGDADRLIIVDENGEVVDGDYILALIATYYKSRDLIKGGGIVATVMSNLGLEKYLETIDLKLHRTIVGDRYVSEKMKELGINVGGEQSGHIILSNYSTTGDGLIAALHVLAVLVEKKIKANEISKLFNRFPQILRNIKYQSGANPLESETVKKAVKQAETMLDGNGRLVIRKSGTEALIRIMAEGDKEDVLKNILDDVEFEIEKVINA